MRSPTAPDPRPTERDGIAQESIEAWAIMPVDVSYDADLAVDGWPADLDR